MNVAGSAEKGVYPDPLATREGNTPVGPADTGRLALQSQVFEVVTPERLQDAVGLVEQAEFAIASSSTVARKWQDVIDIATEEKAKAESDIPNALKAGLAQRQTHLDVIAGLKATLNDLRVQRQKSHKERHAYTDRRSAHETTITANGKELDMRRGRSIAFGHSGTEWYDERGRHTIDENDYNQYFGRYEYQGALSGEQEDSAAIDRLTRGQQELTQRNYQIAARLEQVRVRLIELGISRDDVKQRLATVRAELIATKAEINVQLGRFQQHLDELGIDVLSQEPPRATNEDGSETSPAEETSESTQDNVYPLDFSKHVKAGDGRVLRLVDRDITEQSGA